MTADNSMSRRAGFEVACATGLSLALGLVFVFVRSPLPWGWEGFDAYHERALALARDGVFNTTDVPWGYVAFLAGHYRLFGDKPWIPLTTQVLLNATIPFMTYRLARFWLDERTAAVAALLAGVLSLNTVYASTQSSDAVCNVLFLAGVLVFATGWRLSRLSYACAAGALLGLAPQFRPNLLLFPYALAAATLVRSPRDGRVVRYVSAMLAVVIAASLPWTVRNYRVTGRFVPTSTHGPVQLWYGTLEVGEYFNQRTHNPRALFEYPPLPYTSISDEPIVITAESGSCPSDKTPDVEFWTDRDPGPRRIAARATAGHLQYELPGQPADTALYYRFVSARSGAPVTVSISGDEPFVYFISRDHFADLDRHGDLLDVFDVARLVHHVLWADPVPFADRLDADHDGGLTAADLDAAVKALLWDLPATAGEWQPPPDDVVAAVSIEGEAGVLTFRDGSRLVVPRRFARMTDITASKGFAETLAFSTRRLPAVAGDPSPRVPPCRAVLAVAVNAVFYRREVHQMQRYTALALDNIRRSPGAFLTAALLRAGRAFIILGNSEELEARQFTGSGAIFSAGRTLSIAAVVLVVIGVAICWRRRRVPWLLLLPPAYVAATIAPFFTNMRYTITVQPFMFAVIAVALVAAWDRVRPPQAGRAAASPQPKGAGP
jgi:hypothetical protein